MEKVMKVSVQRQMKGLTRATKGKREEEQETARVTYFGRPNRKSRLRDFMCEEGDCWDCLPAFPFSVSEVSSILRVRCFWSALKVA